MIKFDPCRNSLQSTKSLSKFKMGGTNRVDQLVPALRVRDEGNFYSITTNAANYSSNKEGNKTEDNYIRRIKYLESEFKKKLMDDSVLRNLFKVKIPSDTTHLDIYLEVRRLQETITDQKEREGELKEKLSDLKKSLERQEQEHLSYIEMLGQSIQEKEIEWKTEKRKLQELNEQIGDDCENFKYLLQEIKKKYKELNQKCKDISDQLEMERSAKCLEDLQMKEQQELQTKQYIIQIEALKQENLEINSQLRQARTEIEELVDQKEKIELRIGEMEEISADYAQKLKTERERFIQESEKLKKQHELKLNLIKNSHQQELKLRVQMQEAHASRMKIVEQELNELKTKLRISQQLNEKLQKEVQEYNQKEKIAEKQMANLEKKNVKLSIQLMQVRCEKDQQFKAFTRERLQLEDKENILRNLDSRRMTHSKNASGLKPQIEKKYFRS